MEIYVEFCVVLMRGNEQVIINELKPSSRDREY